MQRHVLGIIQIRLDIGPSPVQRGEDALCSAKQSATVELLVVPRPLVDLERETNPLVSSTHD
ncbi:hypothetical protein [Haloglomus litoreum]|uniref:hypothetical protein n=1 Tax=Haloglomus litoreum TaxID=3034026 RepID=UPI0023E8D1AA|nr:hypothetical protein [Haloglomus sp. DT116]